MSDNERLAYNLRTASDACGLSENSLYRAIKSGELPAERTSKSTDGTPTGRIIILRRDLEAFLERLPDDWWGHKY